MDLTAVKDFFERVQTQAFAENIQEAVKLLTKASSIIFVGVGNSSFIGKYGARYFNNVGWFSFAIDDPFTPVFRGKGERTATIALSVSGETEQTLSSIGLWCTPVTSNTPCVSVPVLSKTTILVFDSASK